MYNDVIKHSVLCHCTKKKFPMQTETKTFQLINVIFTLNSALFLFLKMVSYCIPHHVKEKQNPESLLNFNRFFSISFLFFFSF